MLGNVHPVVPELAGDALSDQVIRDHIAKLTGYTHLTHAQVDKRAQEVAKLIKERFTPQDNFTPMPNPVRLYPVPRGGVPALYAILRHLPGRFVPCMAPQDAHALVDDLVDSGKTWERYSKAHPTLPFYVLYNKINEAGLGWLVFPWEGTEEASIEDNVTRLLQYVGEDTKREGLRETPARVARAWRDWTCGYSVDVAALLKTFDAPKQYDEMVLVRELPFYSVCEHHMAPFFGTASIAYVPNGKIVGLSKLSRLLDAFARRLQVQERLTQEVADAMMEHLAPLGAAVRVRARHLCMESRGIHKQGHETVTTALRGVFRTDGDARNEFLHSAR